MFSTFIGQLASPWNAGVQVERPREMKGRCPQVSVVIPCYNYGHYLTECVKSVLDQRGVQVDVLIIDDASPDGSAELVSRLAAQDSRIHTICHDTNRGHIATYNEGLARARGDYAVLLSADDLLTPGSLYRAISLMEAHPSVGLTYGFSLDLRDDELPAARTIATSWIIWPGHKWIAQMCKTGQNVLRSPEAVMRTRILRQVGGYRADLPHSGDFEMWMRAASVSDIGFVGGADQAYYRIHSNNMHHSTFDLRADVSERLRAFDHIFDERSELLAGAKIMRKTAHRALAREALGHAISAHTHELADRKLIDDYATFALRAWPEAGNLSEWRALSRLRRMPASPPRRDLSLIRREATRNLRYSMGWWRRRWAGV